MNPGLRELCGLVEIVTGCGAHRHGLFSRSWRGVQAWVWRAWRWAIVWTGAAR